MFLFSLRSHWSIIQLGPLTVTHGFENRPGSPQSTTGLRRCRSYCVALHVRACFHILFLSFNSDGFASSNITVTSGRVRLFYEMSSMASSGNSVLFLARSLPNQEREVKKGVCFQRAGRSPDRVRLYHTGLLMSAGSFNQRQKQPCSQHECLINTKERKKKPPNSDLHHCIRNTLTFPKYNGFFFCFFYLHQCVEKNSELYTCVLSKYCVKCKREAVGLKSIGRAAGWSHRLFVMQNQPSGIKSALFTSSHKVSVPIEAKSHSRWIRIAWYTTV